jgi:signal transduction histidine kinase
MTTTEPRLTQQRVAPIAVPGGMPGTALALAVTGWILAVAAVLLYFSSSPAMDGDWLFLLVDAMVSGVYATVAAVILARRRHVVAILLSVTAIGGGLSAFGGGWRQFAEHRGLPPMEPLAALYGTAWMPGTLALFLVLPWFVRDHPLGRDRWGAGTGAIISLGLLLVRVALPDSEIWLIIVLAAAVVMGLVTAVAVERRHRHGPPAERNGLGWLALGVVLMSLSFVPLLVPYGSVPLWVTPALHLGCQALFPAAILVVVLRSRLWGLELAVSRAVVGQTLSLVLIALYVGITALAARVVGSDGPAQVIAAAIVVAAVQPSRLWLQRRVSHLVYGAGHDPRSVAARMGSQLGRAESNDDLLRSLVETIGTTLRLESATLVSDDEMLVAWGVPTSAPLQVQLTHRSKPIGWLWVTTPPGEVLGSRATAALEELSVVLASGLTLAQSVRQLETARDQLTRARLEERRIIRRELHDGLAPWLAGLRLGLRGVSNVIERDPRSAREMLTALQSELDQRIDDVRTVARSLLPPVLDELGLAAALQEMVARHHDNELEVDLVTSGLEGLSSAQAAAGYGIASEAVINVARHSGVGSCRLEVTVTDGELVVKCSDAGRGIAAAVTPGVGTRSMRERAEEQGGRLLIRGWEPHGTVVEARIPVQG